MAAAANTPERTTNLVHSLLPKLLFDELDQGRASEESLSAVARFLINVVAETSKAVQKGDYPKLDGNAGNGGCQAQALALHELTKGDLKIELQELSQKLVPLSKAVEKRRSNPFKGNMGASQFFQECLWLLHLLKRSRISCPLLSLQSA